MAKKQVPLKTPFANLDPEKEFSLPGDAPSSLTPPLTTSPPEHNDSFSTFLQREGVWRWWVVYGFATYFVVFEKLKFLSLYKGFRVNWIASWERWHTMLMSNKGGAPNQYRILSTLLAESVHQFGFSAFTSYLIVRFVCLFLTCLLLHYLWRRWLRDVECFFGITLFLLCSMLSLLPLIQPAEPLNVLMFVICTLCLVERRWRAFYSFLLLGALNKLTLVFMAPLVTAYLFLDTEERSTSHIKSALLHGLATGMLVLGVCFALVGMLGHHKYYTTFWKIRDNLRWMQTDAAGWSFVWFAVLPMALIWLTWKKQPRLVQAHSLMLPLFILGHFGITIVSEVRTFVVTLTLSIPALIVWMLPSGGVEDGKRL